MGGPSSAPAEDAAPLCVELIDCAEVHCLIEEGHELGCLSSAHVATALRDVEVTATQIEELLLVFADMGIEIVEGRRPRRASQPTTPSTRSRWRPSSTSR